MAQTSQITVYNGIVFDSLSEAEVYKELLLMQYDGVISDLQRQVEFELYPKLQNVKIVNRLSGWTAASASKYRTDFTYFDNERQRKTALEVKGFMRPVNKINYRLFLQRYLPEYDFIIATCNWKRRGGRDILESIDYHYYLYEVEQEKKKRKKK